MSVHTDTSRRFNPAERGGRLPVKDSVETREGLIFIRMTDPRVRRERPTWQGNTAEHQLTSTCVTNCFERARLQKGAAAWLESGVPLQRQEQATRAPSLHHRAKNTKFCRGPGQRCFILATFDLSRVGAFKHKCHARACRNHSSDPCAGMAVPPMTTTVTPTEERRR